MKCVFRYSFFLFDPSFFIGLEGEFLLRNIGLSSVRFLFERNNLFDS